MTLLSNRAVPLRLQHILVELTRPPITLDTSGPLSGNLPVVWLNLLLDDLA